MVRDGLVLMTVRSFLALTWYQSAHLPTHLHETVDKDGDGGQLDEEVDGAHVADRLGVGNVQLLGDGGGRDADGEHGPDLVEDLAVAEGRGDHGGWVDVRECVVESI
jgi:hypothetical protein